MQRAADGFIVPDLPENASPEDRATYIVLRLEQFIRDGRTIDEGMSFRKWQAMALTEIAANIAEAQNDVVRDDPVTNRLLFTTASALITIGFWGTAVSINKVGYIAAALVCGFAGLVLLAVAGEWQWTRFWRKRQAGKRKLRLGRIESLNRKIKKLESELEKEAEQLEKALKKTARTAQKIDPASGEPDLLESM